LQPIFYPGAVVSDLLRLLTRLKIGNVVRKTKQILKKENKFMLVWSADLAQQEKQAGTFKC